MTAVGLIELGPDVTTRSAAATEEPAATVGTIQVSTANGTRDFPARLGFGLELAVIAGAPVRVADAVMDRLAVPADPGGLPGSFLVHEPGPKPARPSPRPRFEPRNLDFADGRARWAFGFFLEGPGRVEVRRAELARRR